MSDEFKFTQNSARVTVEAELDNAKTKLAIEKVKAEGGTPEDMFHAVFDTQEKIDDLAKSVSVVALLGALGSFFDLADPTEQEADEPLENRAFVGYFAILQKFVDSEPAQRFDKFYTEAKTKGDVLQFFLEENEATDDIIRHHEKYDHDFFQQWKEMPIGPQFALNRNDYDKLIAQAARNNAEAEARLRQEGKL